MLFWPTKYLVQTLLHTQESSWKLSKVPQLITQILELTVPIPCWITNFFHIERGLLITFEVTVSAHWQAEEFNTFSIEISFRQRTEGTLFPHLIKTLKIIFGNLWPNPYYQIEEGEIVYTLSSVSLATGVTASGYTTQVDHPPHQNHFMKYHFLNQSKIYQDFQESLTITDELQHFEKE